MKKIPAFPPTLYVTLEDPGQDEYYLADPDLAGLGERGQPVAVYTLSHVGHVQVDRAFVQDTVPPKAIRRA